MSTPVLSQLTLPVNEGGSVSNKTFSVGNEVSSSSTNGNIKINGTETTVYTHPGSGTNPHGTTASDVGLGNVGNFKAVSTVASQGLTSTEKSNARANIGAGTGNGTVTQVKVGTTAYDPTSGVVSLPAYPTTLPASDVSSWAKASNKPTYTASEVGAATSEHTHTTSLATSSGTNQITLAANTKYALGAGGTSVIFTTPPDTNTWRGIQDNLTSDSTTDSLSAKQGKALNTRLTSLEGIVGDANTLLEGV